MTHSAGLAIAVQASAVCILDETGKICREVPVAPHPEDLLRIRQDPAWPLERVGLEACPLSQWLCDGLAEDGPPGACLGARQSLPSSADQPERPP